MISINVVGRLAAQPELRRVSENMRVCEFRLLDTRFSKGQEFTEAVTFFCFGDDAEEFCSTTVKGQEIHATGVQETQRYKKGDEERQYVKYRLTWFHRGRKPYTGERQGGNQGYGSNRDSWSSAPPSSHQRPAQHQPMQRPQASQSEQRSTYEGGFEDVGSGSNFL